jgi:hypothetical protein
MRLYERTIRAYERVYLLATMRRHAMRKYALSAMRAGLFQHVSMLLIRATYERMSAAY